MFSIHSYSNPGTSQKHCIHRSIWMYGTIILSRRLMAHIICSSLQSWWARTWRTISLGWPSYRSIWLDQLEWFWYRCIRAACTRYVDHWSSVFASSWRCDPGRSTVCISSFSGRISLCLRTFSRSLGRRTAGSSWWARYMLSQSRFQMCLLSSSFYSL